MRFVIRPRVHPAILVTLSFCAVIGAICASMGAFGPFGGDRKLLAIGLFLLVASALAAGAWRYAVKRMLVAIEGQRVLLRGEWIPVGDLTIMDIAVRHAGNTTQSMLDVQHINAAGISKTVTLTAALFPDLAGARAALLAAQKGEPIPVGGGVGMEF